MVSSNIIVSVICVLVAGVVAYPTPDDIPGSTGHDYIFFDVHVNFTDAIKLCRDEGMHIATLNDNAERSGLSIAMIHGKTDRLWVGVLALDENFAIDVEGNLVEDKFWSVNSPDASKNTLCGSFDSQSVELIHCDHRLPVVCEYNKLCNYSATKAKR